MEKLKVKYRDMMKGFTVSNASNKKLKKNPFNDLYFMQLILMLICTLLFMIVYYANMEPFYKILYVFFVFIILLFGNMILKILIDDNRLKEAVLSR